MKTILLFAGLLLLSAGALMAQSKGSSTKYILFPDYDADIARLQKNSKTDDNARQKSIRSTKEQIFKDYRPQLNTTKPPRPQGSLNANKSGAAKLSSESAAEKTTETPVTPKPAEAPKQ